MAIKYKEMAEKLNEIGRLDYMEMSAVHKCDFLGSFAEKLKPKPEGIVEIGTCGGLSTVTLAQVGNIVYTYDIAYKGGEHVWNLFGVRDKIRCCAGPQWQIDWDLPYVVKRWPQLNFNFAFVDGEHTEKSVRHDFELVKFCKRVLFHNANDKLIHGFLVDEIKADIIGPGDFFAYWEDK